MPEDVCTCPSTDRTSCDVHVECDDNCGALREPVTLEEHVKALDHWENHERNLGCAHGC